jgi:hypothetical protein
MPGDKADVMYLHDPSPTDAKLAQRQHRLRDALECAAAMTPYAIIFGGGRWLLEVEDRV